MRTPLTLQNILSRPRSASQERSDVSIREEDLVVDYHVASDFVTRTRPLLTLTVCNKHPISLLDRSRMGLTAPRSVVGSLACYLEFCCISASEHITCMNRH